MHHNKVQITGKKDVFGASKPTELPVSPAYYPDDEIGLLDIWMVLVKRRKLIAAVFCLVVLFSIFPIFFTEPVYESRAVIAIGQVDGVGSLEPRDALIQRLQEQYRVGDPSEGPLQMPLIDSVESSKKSAANTITITAHAQSAQQARDYLSQVTSKIIKQHQVVFDNAMVEHKKQLDYLEQQVGSFKKQSQQLSETINSITADDPKNMILAIEKAKIAEQQVEIAEKRLKLSLALAAPQSKPTQLMRQPTLPVNPIKPKKRLYLVLAIVVGMVCSVFLAFFLEFVSRAREQLKEKEQQENLPN